MQSAIANPQTLEEVARLEKVLLLCLVHFLLFFFCAFCLLYTVTTCNNLLVMIALAVVCTGSEAGAVTLRLCASRR